MWVMFDSTEVGLIPAHASAVAGYTSGFWPTYPTLVKDFPHAKKLSIAVTAGHDADCLDIENGDATVDQAPAWFRRQRHELHKGLVVLYTSASNVAALVKTMRAAGISRTEYLIWSAHYTFVPHICGAQCTGGYDVDATQWTDRALGRNLDESLCTDHFFGPVPPKPAPLKALAPLERREVELYDFLAEHPHRHPHAVHKVRLRLVQLRKEVWAAADHEIRAGRPRGQAWRFRDRGQRYAILQARTRGL